MSLNERYNELMIFQMTDLEKFFDFENMVDVLKLHITTKSLTKNIGCYIKLTKEEK